SPRAIGVLHVGRVAAPPQAVAVSPDKRTLAVLNGDSELWLYSTASHSPIGPPIHDVVGTPQFTPDGSNLAVQRGPGVELINLRTHQVVRTVRIGHGGSAINSPLMLSADGRVLYVQLTPDTFQLSSSIQSWDLSTGRPLARAELPGVGYTELAFASPSG